MLKLGPTGEKVLVRTANQGSGTSLIRIFEMFWTLFSHWEYYHAVSLEDRRSMSGLLANSRLTMQ